MENRIALIGAMEEEVTALCEKVQQKTYINRAGLEFVIGTLENHNVVVARCGIGKVNASLCTQALIDSFAVKIVINTGVGGGIAPEIEIGDVVVSDSALYHDFDATNFGYSIGQIPRMETSLFPADSKLVQLATEASERILGKSRVHRGIVASGDQFISSTAQKERIASCFNAACVEMEGAAIAHVAYVNKIPFVIVRTISDKADNTAPESFDQFLAQIIPNLNSIIIKTVSSL